MTEAHAHTHLHIHTCRDRDWPVQCSIWSNSKAYAHIHTHRRQCEFSTSYKRRDREGERETSYPLLLGGFILHKGYITEPAPIRERGGGKPSIVERAGQLIRFFSREFHEEIPFKAEVIN